MKYRKSDSFRKIFVVLLAVILAGNCLSYIEREMISTDNEDVPFFQIISAQKQQAGNNRIMIEAWDNLNFEGVMTYHAGKNLFSKDFQRVLKNSFFTLALCDFSVPFIKNLLSNAGDNCFWDTVIIKYIHDIDGKIKFGI